MQQNNPMTEEAERRKRESAQTRCSQLTSEMLLTEGMSRGDGSYYGDCNCMNGILLLVALMAIGLLALGWWMLHRNSLSVGLVARPPAEPQPQQGYGIEQRYWSEPTPQQGYTFPPAPQRRDAIISSSQRRASIPPAVMDNPKSYSGYFY